MSFITPISIDGFNLSFRGRNNRVNIFQASRPIASNLSRMFESPISKFDIVQIKQDIAQTCAGASSIGRCFVMNKKKNTSPVLT